MKFKPSRYNVVSDGVANNHLLYNTLSNNLVLLSKDELSSILEGKFDQISFELGFLVESSKNETISYKSQIISENESNKSLGVVIAPTLTCNYSCNYCYNGIELKNEYKERISSAINFIESKLDDVSSVEITWYGGEPLLKINEILDASCYLQELCKNKGVIYREHLLTNGSLMSLHHVPKLECMALEYVQVSIDWPASDSQRHTRSQSADQALEIVLSNINNIPESLDVYIRINLLPNSFDSLEELIKKIKNKVFRPVKPYFHRIHDSNDEELRDKFKDKYKYNIYSYYEKLIVARKILRDYGFECSFIPEKTMSAGCMAQSNNHITIGHDGSIRKCIREITGDGAIIEGENLNATAEIYLNSIKNISDECLECKYSPLCHGGCPKEQLDNPEKKLERCVPWKFILEKELTNLLTEKGENL